MTTIAWDGEYLAVDRGSWQGYIVNRARKLRDVRAGKRLAGQAWAALSGDAHIAEAMCAWLTGEEMLPLPEAEKNKSCGVVVTHDGTSSAWQPACRPSRRS